MAADVKCAPWSYKLSNSELYFLYFLPSILHWTNAKTPPPRPKQISFHFTAHFLCLNLYLIFNYINILPCLFTSPKAWFVWSSDSLFTYLTWPIKNMHYVLWVGLHFEFSGLCLVFRPVGIKQQSEVKKNKQKNEGNDSERKALLGSR